MTDQSGRVCIVTGAAQGLGAAFARALAGAGASVIAVDRNEERLAEAVAQMVAEGFDVRGIKADVSQAADVERLYEHVTDAFARLDVLVNNAGIFPTAALETLSLADWRRVISVNMDSVFLCTQGAVRLMKTRNYGRIVNIASTTAFTGVAGLSHYAASKAGVIGFTRAAASELGGYGITVNAVAPGLTLTEGTRQDAALLAASPARAKARPVAREAVPEDIVPAMLFMASPASGFITGQTILVNGGEAKL